MWQYGYGDFDPQTKKTIGFVPLPFASKNGWQAGPELPDPKIGWCILTPIGGHPGEKGKAVIRRWISPVDGEIEILATLKHPTKEGDGVRGRIVSSSVGLLGEWKVHNSQADTNLKVKVKKGDTIDFITDCFNTIDHDSFIWTPFLKELNQTSPARRWNAEGDFRTTSPTRPNPWTDLAQVLLLSNEFAFVD